MWVNTQYCGIDDTPTENKSLIILYRIGDEFNGRYRIGDGIGDGVNGKVGRCFEFMFVHNKIKNSIRKFNSKFIVWVNTQYCGIDDTATTINKWIIIYTTGDVFNGRYQIGDGIGDGFNGKGGRYFELFSRMVYPG